MYSTEINPSNLRAELDCFGSHPRKAGITNIHAVNTHLKSWGTLRSAVILLVKLILVMPAMNTASERSSGAMRWIKSYLQLAITHKRLNHNITLHVHKERTDNLVLTDVANEFVGKREHRLHVLGKFWANKLTTNFGIVVVIIIITGEKHTLMEQRNM